MKSLHSAEMAGLAGKATLCALSMTSLRRISSWLQPSPKGRRPNSIWYSITPTAHTSTCVSQHTPSFHVWLCHSSLWQQATTERQSYCSTPRHNMPNTCICLQELMKLVVNSPCKHRPALLEAALASVACP